MSSTLLNNAEKATAESEKLIVKFQHIIESWGVPDNVIMLTRVAISVAIILIIAYLAKKFTDAIILKTIHHIAKNTKTQWDDFLVKRKVFIRLSNLVPAIIASYLFRIALADVDPSYNTFIQILIRSYSAFIVAWTLDAFLTASNDMYMTTKMSKERSIKGYIQLGKIIVYVMCCIIIVAILINKNPGSIILGLGTFTAVLMLVFKDTILGLVASVQLSANDLIKIGDWIEMPAREVDGTVLDISLTSVKVQNWDFSIVSIPTYSLVSESFQNWRNLSSATGRKFQNVIFIDINSVGICTPSLLKSLSNIDILKEKIASGEYKQTSNLNVFREYVELYLRSHPLINNDLTLVVKYQAPANYGIPIEYSCFSVIKDLEPFEKVKATVAEHLWSMVPAFGLKMFQSPSGMDSSKISSTDATR